MSSVYVAEKFAPLTANATATGVVAITSTTGWLAGAIVYLRSTVAPAVECLIAEVLSATTLQLRRTDAKNLYGGGSDLSAYTLAQGASLALSGQTVAVRAVGIVPFEKL